jgi:hypothetical protein
MISKNVYLVRCILQKQFRLGQNPGSDDQLGTTGIVHDRPLEY